MNNYLICLKAMFKNKLRLGSDKSKKSFVAFIVLLCVVYALVMSTLLGIVISMRELLSIPLFSSMFYFFILLTAALIVLVFGIVHLITTLYLSKDTDFYSMLPVKASTVFAAKLSFVYIFETAIVAAVALPLLIAFGITIKAWAGFYLITVFTIFVVPALPLVLSAIIAIPVMFIASKLKNRNVVALVFYLVLFGGFFGLYIYYISVGTSSNITEESMQAMLNGVQTVFYAFYPYAVLATSACGITSFGLGLGASTAVNLVIFYAISIAFLAVIMLAAKFMYSQSVKANNQTYNDVKRGGTFKSSSAIKSLIKREYVSSLRTTQTAFQCYAVMILPIVFSVVMGIMLGNISTTVGDALSSKIDERFFMLIGFTVLGAIFATLGNAAATTFSREGKAMASLKILPVSIGSVLRAKITAWLIPAVTAATISVVVFGAQLFDLQYFLLAVFSLIPLSAALICFGALWDLAAPKLNWTDPAQAIKHNGHVTIGQMAAMCAGLVVTTFVMILYFCGIDFDIISALSWVLIYLELAIFTVVDILLYRRAEKYYNRIEI